MGNVYTLVCLVFGFWVRAYVLNMLLLMGTFGTLQFTRISVALLRPFYFSSVKTLSIERWAGRHNAGSHNRPLYLHSIYVYICCIFAYLLYRIDGTRRTRIRAVAIHYEYDLIWAG